LPAIRPSAPCTRFWIDTAWSHEGGTGSATGLRARSSRSPRALIRASVISSTPSTIGPSRSAAAAASASKRQKDQSQSGLCRSDRRYPRCQREDLARHFHALRLRVL
jgi:hypothetical protein